jgi:hypothetical protein
MIRIRTAAAAIGRVPRPVLLFAGLVITLTAAALLLFSQPWASGDQPPQQPVAKPPPASPTTPAAPATPPAPASPAPVPPPVTPTTKPNKATQKKAAKPAPKPATKSTPGKAATVPTHHARPHPIATNSHRGKRTCLPRTDRHNHHPAKDARPDKANSRTHRSRPLPRCRYQPHRVHVPMPQCVTDKPCPRSRGCVAAPTRSVTARHDRPSHTATPEHSPWH